VTILDQFRARGVTPILVDGRLKLAAVEADLVTRFLIWLAKQHKATIIAALSAEAEGRLVEGFGYRGCWTPSNNYQWKGSENK